MKASNYERIYTGSAIKVNYLKGVLEEAGIKSVIRDDQESQLRAGFGGVYNEQALLFTEKSDSMRAKRITERALEEDAVPDEILEKEATRTRMEERENVKKTSKRPLIKKKSKSNRSVLNIVLNVALILYSAWRLSPLLYGEHLSTWRIALSSFILIFCGISVINYFRKS